MQICIGPLKIDAMYANPCASTACAPANRPASALGSRRAPRPWFRGRSRPDTRLSIVARIVAMRRNSRFLALILLTVWFSRAPFAAVSGQTPSDTRAAGSVESGLGLTVTSGEKNSSDLAVLPNIWLYVPTGQPPTPFLPAGSFTAVWNGFVTIDVRSEFTFQAELNGAFTLSINGVPAWETAGTGEATAPSKPMRLNKGTNALTARFLSPARGDAFLRLFWFNKETPRQPMPLSALTFQTTAASEHARQLRLGRELFVEHRCGRCHAGPPQNSGIPELAMDSPAFDDIGARRNFAWMASWILDPRAQQPTASMPVLLHGPEATQDARAVAAFLASQQSGPAPKAAPALEPAEDQVLAGKKLFDSLHCIACHNALDSPDTDAQKVMLGSVRKKFADGALTAFLLKPEAHFAWTRMPHFPWIGEQASQLAAYLVARADRPATDAAPTDGALLDRGKKLVQTRGCLACHNLTLENQFKAPPLASLAPDKWDKGCLSGSASNESPAPQFTFTAVEREALRAFGATDRNSLYRDVPQEFADRQTRLLRCRECHGKFDGFPALDLLGGKLQPEWTAQFMAGELPYHPRTWLDARMPAFAQRAAELARGLAMQQGYPPHTPAEPPADREAAEVGRKLVSAAGGLSCIACHAIGAIPATQVVESAGINFAYTGRRILRPYFERWVRNPQQIDPNTKMPVFFDEDDRSPLADVYGGDGARQRNAIWQYLRLGDQMPPPPTQ